MDTVYGEYIIKATISILDLLEVVGTVERQSIKHVVSEAC